MASIGNLYFHGTFHEVVGTFTPIPLPGPYTLDDGNGAGDTVFRSGEDVNQPFTDGSVTDGFYGTYEKDGVVYIVCRQGPYYDLYSTTDPAVATLAAGTARNPSQRQHSRDDRTGAGQGFWTTGRSDHRGRNHGFQCRRARRRSRSRGWDHRAGDHAGDEVLHQNTPASPWRHQPSRGWTLALRWCLQRRRRCFTPFLQ